MPVFCDQITIFYAKSCGLLHYLSLLLHLNVFCIKFIRYNCILLQRVYFASIHMPVFCGKSSIFRAKILQYLFCSSCLYFASNSLQLNFASKDVFCCHPYLASISVLLHKIIFLLCRKNTLEADWVLKILGGKFKKMTTK